MAEEAEEEEVGSDFAIFGQAVSLIDLNSGLGTGWHPLLPNHAYFMGLFPSLLAESVKALAPC